MTFAQWLTYQAWRRDAVGDVARVARRDTRRKPYTRAGWARYLQAAGIGHKPLQAAWNEYEAAKR